MYLKSLQLIGFKSFAEKTTLEFLPGVTAVVGPNGCGKSNISDAIRWVLGEQSAKALRGSEMADVIFNGTDGRRAINLAEVSMTFAEVDPTSLSLPGVNLDFSEITISRRVHRDGNGEYFINKTPCRLRDIQGLFMDTGIGRSSYSLMAQGQIDQILSAHPEDRRTIFEEAAGINKYKHQKKEALRKLEYTEANLVRITDIIKEVKRQIISLQRQAGKARRYKELFDQLKGIDTRLARHKYDLLHSEISNLESQIANFVQQSEAFSSQIAEKEQQIADLRHSLAEIERAISEAVNRDHELKSEADRHQHLTIFPRSPAGRGRGRRKAIQSVRFDSLIQYRLEGKCLHLILDSQWHSGASQSILRVTEFVRGGVTGDSVSDRANSIWRNILRYSDDCGRIKTSAKRNCDTVGSVQWCQNSRK